jgi:hypothetical protein
MVGPEVVKRRMWRVLDGEIEIDLGLGLGLGLDWATDLVGLMSSLR